MLNVTLHNNPHVFLYVNMSKTQASGFEKAFGCKKKMWATDLLTAVTVSPVSSCPVLVFLTCTILHTVEQG
jgi:hypothetical protein